MGGKRQNKDKSIYKLKSQRRNASRSSRHCNRLQLSNPVRWAMAPLAWMTLGFLDSPGQGMHEGFESWGRGKQTWGPVLALPVVTSGQGHLWVSVFLQGKWRCVWLHESPKLRTTQDVVLKFMFIFYFHTLSWEGCSWWQGFFSLGRWFLFCAPVALAGFMDAEFPHCG